MRKNYPIFCSLLFVLLYACILSAQDQESRPIFSAFDTKVTTTNFIFDLYLDKNGLLWMATDRGLIKWDGLHKSLFDNSPSQKDYQLQGEKVLTILEDENQNFIIGNRASPPGYEQINLDTEKPQSIDFTAIKTLEEELVNLWSVPDSGIFLCIVSKTAVHFYQFLPSGEFVLLGSPPIDFNTTNLRKRYTTNGKDHWLAVEGKGVWRWSNNHWDLAIDLDTLNFGNTVEPKIFHADQKGNLWLSFRNQKGLWRAESQQLELKQFSIPFSQALSAVTEDKNKNLVFIAGQYPESLKEIWSYQNNQWVDFNWITSKYPTATKLYAVNFKENIFVATANNIYLLQQESPVVKQYLRQELKKDQYGTIIKGINEDNEGNVYFLSENKYLFRLNRKDRKENPTPTLDTLQIKDLNTNTILNFNCGGEIIKDQKGYFWFKLCSSKSFKGILARFNPKTEEYRLFRQEHNMRSLALEPGKGIWVGVHDQKNKGMIFFFDFKEERFIPLTDQGIACDFSIPKYLHVDQDSLLWIGTTQGLGKVNLKEKSFDLYTTENSDLPNNHIITIYQKEKDQLILGTNGGGLVFFQPSNLDIKIFSKKDGLGDNNVCGILPTDDGHLWVSTFDGISYFNADVGFFTNFSTSSGFNYDEFNRYAFHKSKSGEYFFGNINGANSFTSAELLQNKDENHTGLAGLQIYYGEKDSLYIQQKGLKTIDKIVLPHDFTYIQFDLYHTGYLQREGQKIFTRLLGYDSEWTITDPAQPLRYRNLRSGKYPLYFSTKNNKALSIPSTPDLIIEVRPPFYQTWWFIISSVALLFGGLWFWNRQRIQRIKKEAAEKSETNLKFAELELQALQAQLNPHFIFNSLGAIQYFIKTNEKEKADGYLTSFARLMRLFLESSKNKYITLAEEIEMLGIYIDLEQLRFKESFTSTITIDPELDPAQIYMPSLLLQPFIENSINHGLFHKKEKGHLALDFSPLENDGLLVTLEDNGIGRAKAQEIKNKSVLNYKSRAMQIINERREVLSKVEDYHIDIEIKDLYLSDGSAAGTKVIIKVPEIE